MTRRDASRRARATPDTPSPPLSRSPLARRTSIEGWASDPADPADDAMRVLVLVPSFSWAWPGYQVEGV